MDRLDTPEAYDDLTETEKAALAHWIAQTVCSSRKYSLRTSYGIKHDFQANRGFYLTNGQFKGAMLKAGFQPKDPNQLNWTFKIKPCKKSNPRADPTTYEILPQHPSWLMHLKLLEAVRVEGERRAEERARTQPDNQEP